MGLYRRPYAEQIHALALWGVENGHYTAAKLRRVLDDAPAPPRPQKARPAPEPAKDFERPGWLQPINDDARRRSDHFRVD